MPRIVEIWTLREWADKHGQPYEAMHTDERSEVPITHYIALDGSQCWVRPDEQVTHQQPPPPDTRECAKIKLLLVRKIVANEQRDFNQYKKAVLEAAEMHKRFPNSVMPPPADAHLQLEEGRDRIQYYQQMERELMGQMVDPEQAKFELAKQEENQRTRDAMHQFEQQVESIVY